MEPVPPARRFYAARLGIGEEELRCMELAAPLGVSSRDVATVSDVPASFWHELSLTNGLQSALLVGQCTADVADTAASATSQLAASVASQGGVRANGLLSLLHGLRPRCASGTPMSTRDSIKGPSLPPFCDPGEAPCWHLKPPKEGSCTQPARAGGVGRRREVPVPTTSLLFQDEPLSQVETSVQDKLLVLAPPLLQVQEAPQSLSAPLSKAASLSQDIHLSAGDPSARTRTLPCSPSLVADEQECLHSPLSGAGVRAPREAPRACVADVASAAHQFTRRPTAKGGARQPMSHAGACIADVIGSLSRDALARAPGLPLGLGRRVAGAGHTSSSLMHRLAEAAEAAEVNHHEHGPHYHHHQQHQHQQKQQKQQQQLETLEARQADGDGRCRHDLGLDNVRGGPSAAAGDIEGHAAGALAPSDALALHSDSPRENGDSQLLHLMLPMERHTGDAPFLAGLPVPLDGLGNPTLALEDDTWQALGSCTLMPRKRRLCPTAPAMAPLNNTPMLPPGGSGDVQEGASSSYPLALSSLLQSPGKASSLLMSAGEAKKAEVLLSRLLRAADALEKKDAVTFQMMYDQLRSSGRSRGQPIERLMHYALQGLALRSTGKGSLPFAEPLRRKKSDLYAASNWFRRSTPVVPFGLALAKCTFLQHLSGVERAQVIDFGASLVPCWPEIFASLSRHPGRAPKRLHITAVDVPALLHPRRRSIKSLFSLRMHAEWLENLAAQHGIALTLTCVSLGGNAVTSLMSSVARQGDETIVICTGYNLMHFPGAGTPGQDATPRDKVLKWFCSLAPAVVVVMEVEMDVCGKPLVDRLPPCLGFYQTFFTMNESTLSHASDRNWLRLYEELFAGSFIVNLTACEGSDWVVQPESLEKLQSRCRKAGLTPQKLDLGLIDEVSQRVTESHSHSSLIVQEDAVRLAWRGVPLISCTLWKGETNVPKRGLDL